MENRVKGVSALFVLLLAVMAARAFALQVVLSHKIVDKANRRFEHTVELTPYRGAIQDRGGHPLAVSLDVKSIAINARKLRNPDATANQLAGILGVDRQNLVRKLRSRRHFVWVKRQANPDEIAKVQALKLPQISLHSDTKRFYPESEAMGNLLGFVGIDGNGLEGLELMYDKLLAGQARQAAITRDGHNRVIYAHGLNPAETKNGCNLTLTIDRRLQYVAFSELRQAVDENNAQAGFVIITNPNTGEVLAMTSYPSYNPNKRGQSIGHTNRAVSQIFEPGSIMKPFWVAWGIDKGLFNASSSVFCENGQYTYRSATFHDHEKYGWLPLRDIIKVSSNIGMVKLMAPVPADSMYATMQRFGLTGTTKLDFPGESRSMIRQPDQWTSTDKSAISFGQGFAVSGIQTITAFNALVNGGYIIKPHLVRAVSDPSGKILSRPNPSVSQPVISRQSSDQIVSMMKSVVMKGGTAETAYMDNYQVFGKTGTAQKIDPLTGRYAGGGYISSFVGGIEDATGRPVLTMMVTIDDPHPSYYASIVACPAFKRIIQKTVNIMDIRPLITVAAKENQG